MSDRKNDFAPTEIGVRLALTRQALGIPQGVFAQRAGLQQSTYSQYETGQRRPSIESAVALADTYNLTLDWIFLGDPSNLPYHLADAIKAIRAARQ